MRSCHLSQLLMDGRTTDDGRRPITKAHLVTCVTEMRTSTNSGDPHGQHYLLRRKRFSKNEIQFNFLKC